MQQPTTAPYPISDFLEWEMSKKLVITPKFQRRDVWIPKAKSFLIDTILKNMPIPPIFIRQRVDPIKLSSIREVIDGQQRLKAVLRFIKGEYPIMKIHNEDLGGLYYASLPDDVQKSFLGYKFTVNIFDDISDSDVLNIFARINTYAVKLVPQELRNAEFFGLFKQSIYTLAHQHYAFWINNKILTESQIARMGDAELVSELVVSMLDGIQQTKAADLHKYYIKFDDEYSDKNKIEKEFADIINLIGEIFQENLSSTEFKRSPLFYTLFLVLFDAKYGLPNSNKQRLKLSAKELRKIAGKLTEIDSYITLDEVPEEYALFNEFTRLSTADVGKRKFRHDFLWDQLLSVVG